MTEWYYARGGQQSGPVTFEALKELAASGGLNATKDLVWTATMPDWKPAGQVDGLFLPAAVSAVAPVVDPSNPYAAPQSSWVEPSAPSSNGLVEIIPGSEPLNATACIKRGFELTKRQFGMILLVGLVYFALLMVPNFFIGLIQGFAGLATSGAAGSASAPPPQPSGALMVVFVLLQLAYQVFSIYLGLGLTQVALNLVSGKEVAIGLLFSQGSKLLKAIGATILFGLMVGLGFLLLIVPGVYLALRYGQYMTAIVDRDLGIKESFAYSSSITTNNRGQIFVLWILCFLIALAGMLACGVGLIFAGPVVWLAMVVAYRWMQYGHKATLDHPGTVHPLLTGR